MDLRDVGGVFRWHSTAPVTSVARSTILNLAIRSCAYHVSARVSTIAFGTAQTSLCSMRLRAQSRIASRAGRARQSRSFAAFADEKSRRLERLPTMMESCRSIIATPRTTMSGRGLVGTFDPRSSSRSRNSAATSPYQRNSLEAMKRCPAAAGESIARR